ncbi:menaquinone biosynthesis protein [bacterium]|nr:menaquinone biosynthesis protein [bacterium]
MSHSNLRLGIVPYLNVLPLLRGLDDRFPQENWIRATPRELGGQMAAREIDVATLPIFEALRAQTYWIVPGCAIACDGPVRSVRIVSLKPLTQIRSLLLDRSSLTSVHLAQILTKELLEIDPVLETSSEPLPREFDLAASGFDAAVVIGDVALDWEDRFEHTLDFGQGWKDLTGLPFVFAAWVARQDVDLSPADLEAFVEARQRGEREVWTIAQEAADASDRPVQDLVNYLGRAIRFRLGEQEIVAIDEFRRRLIRHDLLPASAVSPAVGAQGMGAGN